MIMEEISGTDHVNTPGASEIERGYQKSRHSIQSERKQGVEQGGGENVKG